jgi:transposase-like protein
MTDDRIALQALLEKGSDTTLLRGMIGFAAQRLMELEAETLCGAAHGERSESRSNHRNGYRDRDWQTRAGRSSCAFRSCATAATSLASSNPAEWGRRR